MEREDVVGARNLVLAVVLLCVRVCACVRLCGGGTCRISEAGTMTVKQGGAPRGSPAERSRLGQRWLVRLRPRGYQPSAPLLPATQTVKTQKLSVARLCVLPVHPHGFAAQRTRGLCVCVCVCGGGGGGAKQQFQSRTDCNLIDVFLN